jgi:hypothetical protein
MRAMRRLGLLLSFFAFACGTPLRPNEENQISFTLTQRRDPASGTWTTTGAYEVLNVAGKKRVADAHYNEAAACFVEDVDQRKSLPKAAAGVATYRSAKLPDGLRIFANAADASMVAGPAWASGETLTFEANGFGMPAVRDLVMPAPYVELALTAPPIGASIDLGAGGDFEIAWEPRPDIRDLRGLKVTLAADEASGHGSLTCTYRTSVGRGAVPRAWLDKLAALADEDRDRVRGSLRIETSTSGDIDAAGEWWVFVGASAIQLERPFSLPRR